MDNTNDKADIFIKEEYELRSTNNSDFTPSIDTQKMINSFLNKWTKHR